jgi:hypothetical protein
VPDYVHRIVPEKLTPNSQRPTPKPNLRAFGSWELGVVG